MEHSRYNDQFRETVEERNARLRAKRHRRTIEYLEALIADLSDSLCDEGPDWSEDGLLMLRWRVANALPLDRCPDWLRPYRDPPLVQSFPSQTGGRDDG